MPLPEFYKMAAEKLESPKQRSTPWSTDLSFLPGNEIVELVWENGQIMMQGQSSRARKSPASNNLESHNSGVRDKGLGNAITNSKMGRFGLMDSVLDDFQTVVPAGEIDFGQDEDMVAWLNYPINDPLQHDYCSELLPELSGVTTNEVSVQNSFASVDKRISFNQTAADSHESLQEGNASKVSSLGAGSEPLRSKSCQLYPWAFQQGQPMVACHRSGATRNTDCTIPGDSVHCQAKQGMGMRNSNSGFLNFSHFSRPAALARVNLQPAGSIPSHRVGALGAKSNEPVLMSRNLAESMSNLTPASRKETELLPSKMYPKPGAATPTEDLCFVRESDAIKDRSPTRVLGESATNGTLPHREKNVEPIVASSLCSVNGAERASGSPTPNLKRKCHETDDSGCRSEDVDEESVGVRKAAPPARGGTGSKKNRAAEVHNLSERRRRDRINEKMRALQELIPNCNKADKASMLDEAIEYLKTLQLKVQIMSMGAAALYMPQMMLPPGMQPLHAAAHMARFSPMGVNTGMGMGFGMCMLDMNSGTPRCPMFQVPPIQLPGSFQGGPGSNFQILGHTPGQGLPVSGPCPPLVPFSVGHPPNTGLNAAPDLLPHSASPANSKDLMQNSASKLVHNVDTSSS